MGEKAVGNGDNIILPLLGRNEESLNEIIQSLKENKYNIIMARVDVPINIAKLRNFKRAIETGRYVSDDIISKEVDNTIKTNYNKLTKEQINVRAEIDGTTTEGVIKYITGSREEIEGNIRGWREIRARDVEGNAPKLTQETKPIIALGDDTANILDKEFSLNTKLDDFNEIVPELKTIRQILDEENQTNLFINRLADCV